MRTLGLAVAAVLFAGGASAQVEPVNPEDIGVYTTGPITSRDRPQQRTGQVPLFGRDWNLRVAPADPFRGPQNLLDLQDRLDRLYPPAEGR